VPLGAIHEVSPHAALAVERIRTGQVHRDPGFDGVFGTIKVFASAQERAHTLNQVSLFD